MNIEKKNRLAQDSLARINLWISHADQKIGIALLFQAGLVAFITTSKFDDVRKILSQNLDLIHFLFYSSLVLFAYFIILAAFYSFKALFPKTTSNYDSLFFFGSIINRSLDQYKKEMISLNEEDVMEDLNTQVYINSQIANSKFKDIKKAIVNTGLASIFWTIILIMASYLK